MDTLLGVLVVGAGGLVMGSSAWPFKLMRRYQFEHWWFIGMLVGLIIMPWTITLVGCNHVAESLRGIPVSALVLGNLFAVGWGIANILCGICFVRIGVALTGAILAGLGVSVGAITPMIFKGSGLFQDAAGLMSPAGLTVCGGVAVMLVGVVLASMAGFGRDRELQRLTGTVGGFPGGLIMAALAGVLSACISFAFVYTQGPIVASLSTVYPSQTITLVVEGNDDLSGKYEVTEAGTIHVGNLGSVAVAGRNAADAARHLEQRLVQTTDTATANARASEGLGPPARTNPHPVAGRPFIGNTGLEKSQRPTQVSLETGSIPATFGVFAIGLLGGATVNIGYAAYLLTRNQSWGVFGTSGKELVLAIIIGVNFSLAVALMGKGMLLLGALGASIGFGIQQAMQMTGSQLLGFISGEWGGVFGKPRLQMYLAIGVLIVAAGIMAFGNTLAKG